MPDFQNLQYRLNAFFEQLKYRFSVDRVYVYILGGVVVVILIIIAYFIFRPGPPEIPQPPAGNLSRSLVGYWAFDERSDRYDQAAINSSREQAIFARFGASNGSDASDPERIKKGVSSRALAFDGVDDYMTVRDAPLLRIEKEITIAGWFNADGIAVDEPEPVWLSDFDYRKQLELDYTKGRENLVEFQLAVTLDTETLIREGKMMSSCDDMRFTTHDETTIIPHWLESGCNTAETRVWIQIPELGAGFDTNLFVYYGNPEAEDVSDFFSVMEESPVRWWHVSETHTDDSRKSIRSAAVSETDQVLAAGSSRERGPTGWRGDLLNEDGSPRARGAFGYSEATDEALATAFAPAGGLVLGGYDAVPGDLRWRAGMFTGFFSQRWEYTENFSPGSDEIRGVAVDPENNVILAGYDSSPGDPQWRIVKLNQAGQFVWSYTINPSDQADIISDVAVDSRGNVIAAGFEKVSGGDRWRIEKLDPSGNLIYSWRLGVSRESDVLNAVTVDSQDNIIAVGYNFVPGDAQWWIVKLTPDGTSEWQISKNPSPGFDELTGVAVDAADNVVVAGYETSEGNSQWAMMKFTPEGKEIWEWRDNPTEGADEVRDLAIDSDNNMILAATRSTGGHAEWWVVKLSERKPLEREPVVTVGTEEVPRQLTPYTVLGKGGAYQVSAAPAQVVGFVNGNSIFANVNTVGWHHFAMTYDGSRQVLYLDGQLVNNRALGGDITTNRDNLIIGYNYAGLLDELFLYDRALTQEEIFQLYSLAQ